MDSRRKNLFRLLILVLIATNLILIGCGPRKGSSNGGKGAASGPAITNETKEENTESQRAPGEPVGGLLSSADGRLRGFVYNPDALDRPVRVSLFIDETPVEGPVLSRKGTTSAGSDKGLHYFDFDLGVHLRNRRGRAKATVIARDPETLRFVRLFSFDAVGAAGADPRFALERSRWLDEDGGTSAGKAGILVDFLCEDGEAPEAVGLALGEGEATGTASRRGGTKRFQGFLPCEQKAARDGKLFAILTNGRRIALSHTVAKGGTTLASAKTGVKPAGDWAWNTPLRSWGGTAGDKAIAPNGTAGSPFSMAGYKNGSGTTGDGTSGSDDEDGAYIGTRPSSWFYLDQDEVATDPNACGSTSLAMILANEGLLPQTLEAAQAFDKSIRGWGGFTAPKDLRKAAKEKGLHSSAINEASFADLERAIANGNKVMTMIEGGSNPHWVVVLGIERDPDTGEAKIVYADPGSGSHKTASWEDFKKKWDTPMKGAAGGFMNDTIGWKRYMIAYDRDESALPPSRGAFGQAWIENGADGVSDVANGWTDLMNGEVISGIGGMLGGAVKVVTAIPGAIGSAIDTVGGKMMDWGADQWKNGGFFGKIAGGASWLAGGVTRVAGKVVEGVGNVVSTVASGVVNAVGGAAKKVGNFFKSIF